ncbi:MAG: double-strand break repair helicase AddA [Sphingomicrobium sp.]
MARPFKPLPVLEGDQARAADPSAHAALSASAGTGKTQVLTARVLRLLLQGVEPSAILCLTFTKSGAAEMANRIGDRLARWVRLPDNLLSHELFALGEDDRSPPALQRARRLFARVLETPGGLRIQTIHAFAQTLLASFPAEAGISSGFQPIEGRAEQELARRTLADLLAGAEAGGDRQLIADVAALSMRLGEEEAVGYLMRCAHAGEAIRSVGDSASVERALRGAVGLPDGDIEGHIVDACSDGQVDRSLFERLIAANRAWGSATGIKIAERLAHWLALDGHERAQALEGLNKNIITKDGVPCKVSPKQLVAEPDYEALALRFGEWHAGLLALRGAAALVAVQAAGLRAGSAFAAAYTAAKRAAGVADFDDLIAWTRRLFASEGMGAWVRYKLDRQTDHILVDESQDTNADQWTIVKALMDEFFAGSGAREVRARTFFMVGDFKQAIFGFQGTDPQEFNAMRRFVRERAQLLIEAEDQADFGGERLAREFRDLSIDASFRSAPAILEAVDAVIREVGYAEMGLPERPNAHRAVRARWPGRVEHWPPFVAPEADSEDEGDEGWLSDTDRLYATRLADEVRKLVEEAPLLASTGRPLCPGDIMILVRSRKELAALLVARLFTAGVPVAGIDRLHLQKPLAVRDLIAAMTFAVQPLDDLNLASLLVSPLLGWDQQQLYDLAYPRAKEPLWRALTAAGKEDPFAADTVEALQALLAMADYVTPARFLETILSGALDGRRKLLGRLGEAARDPIDELLASALEFERSEIASLDRFLAWFARGDVEIKRDTAAPVNAVRVMTVHGAKGLEAPVVILADATADPARMGGSRGFDLPIGGEKVPLVRPRKVEMVSPFAEVAALNQQRELQEHWRLLYVALTRAAERLIVAGIMPRKLSDDSWTKRVERALTGLGAVPDGQGRLTWTGSVASGVIARKGGRTPLPSTPLPDWLRRAPPAEPRPPRPLAPSVLGEDRESSAPPSPAQAAAARRGTLLHALFERLPGVGSSERRQVALEWLERAGEVSDPQARAEIAEAALAVIEDSRFAELFAASALAEAPIAATLPDGRVIAGTVDRLCIGEDVVRVIDFKTGRHAPAGIAEVPPSHVTQMDAYRQALGVIFPGRRIEAALLYTAAPRLIALPG